MHSVVHRNVLVVPPVSATRDLRESVRRVRMCGPDAAVEVGA